MEEEGEGERKGGRERMEESGRVGEGQGEKRGNEKERGREGREEAW